MDEIKRLVMTDLYRLNENVSEKHQLFCVEKL